MDIRNFGGSIFIILEFTACGFLVVSCSASLPNNDKTSSIENIIKCRSALPQNDDYELETSCVKLSGSKIFRGVWTIDFETSVFRDTKDVLHAAELQSDLIVKPGVLAKFGSESDKGRKMYFVIFEGRASPLLSRNKPILILDKIINIRELR